MAEQQVDPITFEIVRHKLWQINDEQGITVGLISGSPIITESNDFNVTIMTREGDQIFLGSFYTRNAAPLGQVVKYILEKRAENPGIHEGDMFLNNDPWIGSIHQQDVMVLAPVFWQGEIVFWTGCNLHQIDMGGSKPGGFTVGAKSRYEEPPIFPVVKIVDRGVLRKDFEHLFLRQSRTPELASLDLKALIAGNTVAGRRLRELISRYGVETVKAVQQAIISYTEALFKKRLRELPDGAWSKTLFMDHFDDGEYHIYPLKLTVRKRSDRLVFDFTGTSRQAPGFVNCTLACTRACIMANVLPSLCYDMPWTPAGIWGSIEIISEPGTLNNATEPTPVSMASVGAGRCTTEVVQACLAKMLGSSEKYRGQASAGWGGGYMGNVIAGEDRFGEGFTGIIETARGSGATARKDGVDCGDHFDMPKRRMPNVEAMEYFFPILYLWNRMEADSGGAGKHRGGVTNSFAWMPHRTTRPLTSVVLSFGVLHPQGSGLFGGNPANTNRAVFIRDSNIKDLLSRGKVPQTLNEIEGETQYSPSTYVTRIGLNDVMYTVSSGGGGCMDPLERDPKLVAVDLVNGLTLPETAGKVYGVVFDHETFEPDLGASERLRERIRRERLQKPDHIMTQEQIEEVKEEGGAAARCVRCGFEPASLDEAGRFNVIAKESSITEAGPLVNPYEPGESERYVLCEYLCPRCLSRFNANIQSRRGV